MGLFDGATPTSDEGSTAELARWLRAPVALLVDASGLARSLAALAQGYARFDPDVQVAAVLANRIGGRGHLELLRAALAEPPLAGGLPVRPELGFPERHLGLRTASDPDAIPDPLLERWGALAAEWLDVDSLLTIARSAPPLPALPGTDDGAEQIAASASARCRIGLALDEAFHFYYEDNLRRLEALGAQLVRFSPVHDATLPDVDGLYFGGGYPEASAGALAENRSLRETVRRFAARGGPIYAECGGLMYLARGIRTLDGRLHEMVGLVPAQAVMSDRLAAIGYVGVETQAPSLLGPAGLRFRGHEFRYSALEPAPALEPVYRLAPRWGGAPRLEGYRCGRNGCVLASYVHAHWASCPEAAAGFVAACTEFARGQLRD